MSIPLNDHAGQNNSSVFFDVSPERLDKMSLAELKEEMERALDVMSEETYDPAVIDAYLEAMDRKDPMPTLPDPEEAYNALRSKLLKELQEPEEPEQTPISKSPLKRRFKMGLVAVAAAMCLLGSMVVAQAAGADVFGALARWTEDTFSFGSVRSERPTQETSFSANFAELPPEYQELRDELEKRDVNSFLFPTYIPDEFVFDDCDLSISPESDTIDYTAWYTDTSNEITLEILLSDTGHTVFEKDSEDVEIYETNGIDHYIFTNIAENVAVWCIGDIEYSLTTQLPIFELKAMINSMYQE